MDATAPCILALSVSLDAVATLSLVLLSYDGPFWQAMLPRTGDLRLDVAGSLADLLGLQLLRSSLAMLPLLGVGLGTAPFGAVVSALIDVAMTAWLVAKAVLQVQLADGHWLQVGDTGVTLRLPLLLAAEVFGIVMTWIIFALVWANRRVIRQPAGRGGSSSARGPYVALMAQNAPEAQQQQASVVSWLAHSGAGDVETGASIAGQGGSELAQPLLLQQGVGGRGVDDDDAESFVTAASHSRQGSRASSLGSMGSGQELFAPSAPSVRSSSRLGPQ